MLQYDFIPYWSGYVDEEYGGILNCISNAGGQLLGEDKFTWSQGRWLWILGKLHELKKKGVFRALSREQLEKWMKGTWDFLNQYSIYGDSVCCYVLTRDGKKKEDAPEDGMPVSMRIVLRLSECPSMSEPWNTGRVSKMWRLCKEAL